MLHNIQTAKPASPPETAISLLVGCHERIRRFSSIVRNLAHAEGSSPDEIRNAAASAYRYFTVSLPLHEADEEESLHPRLQVEGTQEICAALDAMHHQHEAIDDLLERLLPILTLLSHNPSKLGEVHGELCGLSSTLSQLFDGHLQLEEEVIFPAVSLTLTSETQAELLREMRERREQG